MSTKKTYALDWCNKKAQNGHKKKELHIYNIEKEESFSIEPTNEKFEKFLEQFEALTTFYMEDGGGDSFKILIRGAGHKIFTIPGHKTKEYRDEFGLKKNDQTDAFVIGQLSQRNPELFHEFKEVDDLTLKISLIFKERVDSEIRQTREKNKLFAMKNRLELVSLDGFAEKLIEKQENVITSNEEKFILYKKLNKKLIEQHPLWEYLRDIKGVDEGVTGGLISRIKRFSRFSTFSELRKFANMMPKDPNNQAYDHTLKRALYFFTGGIIRAGDPVWRPLYDEKKEYYVGKYPDWKKGKIDGYARKAVQTKFLKKCWQHMIKIEKEMEKEG